MSPPVHSVKVGTKYKLGELLGKGAFGVVYKALNTESGALVAIKQLSLASMGEEHLTNIQLEIDLLKTLRHPNIVKYIESIRTAEHLNIVLEFVEGGSLASLIAEHGVLDEVLAAVFTRRVLEGLMYLHEQGVVHRDIKGANILYEKTGHVKLADFGVARKLAETEKASSVVGTPYWMAPEIINMAGECSGACDLWSVGCTVIEMITGKPPYFDLLPMPALFRIVQDPMPPLPMGISIALQDFLQCCFQKDPTLRSTADQLLRHEWLDSVKKLNENGNLAVEDGEEDNNSELSEKAIGGARLILNQSRPPNLSNRCSKITSNFDGFRENASDPFDAVFSLSPPIQSAAVPQIPSVDLCTSIESLPEIGEPTTAELGGDAWPVNAHSSKKVNWSRRLRAHSPNISSTALLRALNSIPIPHSMANTGLKTDINAIRHYLSNVLPFASPDNLRIYCSELLATLTASPPADRIVIAQLGAVPFLELLVRLTDDVVVEKVLQIINLLLVSSPQKFLINIALIGLIPPILKFATRDWSHAVRIQAASFIALLTNSGDVALETFVTSGGLEAVARLLECDYYSNSGRDLVFLALDSLKRVLMMRTLPKNDFCRLFAKLGVCSKLALLLDTLSDDATDERAPKYLHLTVDLICRFSQADSTVKRHLVHHLTLDAIVSALEFLNQELSAKLTRCLKYLCQEAMIANALENVGVVPTLVGILKRATSGMISRNKEKIKVEKTERKKYYHLQKRVVLKQIIKQGGISLLQSEFQKFLESKQSSFNFEEGMVHSGYLKNIYSDKTRARLTLVDKNDKYSLKESSMKNSAFIDEDSALMASKKDTYRNSCENETDHEKDLDACMSSPALTYDDDEDADLLMLKSSVSVKSDAKSHFSETDNDIDEIDTHSETDDDEEEEREEDESSSSFAYSEVSCCSEDFDNEQAHNEVNAPPLEQPSPINDPSNPAKTTSIHETYSDTPLATQHQKQSENASPNSAKRQNGQAVLIGTIGKHRIFKGPCGSLFYLNKSGHRTYVPRNSITSKAFIPISKKLNVEDNNDAVNPHTKKSLNPDSLKQLSPSNRTAIPAETTSNHEISSCNPLTTPFQKQSEGPSSPSTNMSEHQSVSGVILATIGNQIVKTPSHGDLFYFDKENGIELHFPKYIICTDKFTPIDIDATVSEQSGVLGLKDSNGEVIKYFPKTVVAVVGRGLKPTTFEVMDPLRSEEPYETDICTRYSETLCSEGDMGVLSKEELQCMLDDFYSNEDLPTTSQENSPSRIGLNSPSRLSIVRCGEDPMDKIFDINTPKKVDILNPLTQGPALQLPASNLSSSSSCSSSADDVNDIVITPVLIVKYDKTSKNVENHTSNGKNFYNNININNSNNNLSFIAEVRPSKKQNLVSILFGNLNNINSDQNTVSSKFHQRQAPYSVHGAEGLSSMLNSSQLNANHVSSKSSCIPSSAFYKSASSNIAKLVSKFDDIKKRKLISEFLKSKVSPPSNFKIPICESASCGLCSHPACVFIRTVEEDSVSQSLHALYSLCRVSHRQEQAALARLEQAVLAGAVPCLRFLSFTHKTVGHFAFQLLCELTLASNISREYLHQSNIVGFLVAALYHPLWRGRSISCLAKWVEVDRLRVEPALIKRKSKLMSALAEFIADAPPSGFSDLINRVNDMVHRSKLLAKIIVNSDSIMQNFINKIRLGFDDKDGAERTENAALLAALRLLFDLLKVASDSRVAMLEQRLRIVALLTRFDSRFVTFVHLGAKITEMIRQALRKSIPKAKDSLDPLYNARRAAKQRRKSIP